ncbi:transporter, major facilitator family [Lactobacillus selangorensis]|nr:transporter, major facilitator family [Lactobacillus selangorensis]
MKTASGFKKVMLIVSLLLLNIVEQAASAISASIPQMAASFPQHSEVQIELVTTVVSISVTIFVLVSGLVIKKIGQKQTAILGLVIASVASIVPAFSNSFNVIMISRVVLGIGIGLVNPLAISLIGEFFHGDTLASLMGWRTAVASIGVSVMTFLAGQLLKINWHASYLVYLLFIPALILFFFFVPSPEKMVAEQETENKDGKKESEETNTEPATENGHSSLLIVIGLSLLLMVYMACAMISYIKMALMYIQTGIGSPSQASTVISVLGFAQLIGGALFGLTYKKLHRNVLPLGVGLSGILMVLMTFTKSNGMIMLLGGLSGLFGGLAVPYIFTRISQVSNTKTAPLHNAFALVGSNLGSFVAPILASVLGATAVLSLRNAGYVIVALAVIVLVVFIFDSQKTKAPSAD